ncbi:MAG: GTP cyclohydrolase I FolE [Candidatus Heimdallarchaeota archaeon]|nr:GTP cyclohydrolase I FolE [Candidatus Heimdallarchaeota archaeon]
MEQLPIKSEDNPILENKEAIELRVKEILELIGEDTKREGLLETPHRVAKMFAELFRGYFKDLNTVVNGALFSISEEEQEMVVVEAIPYNSLCEHHMLPFMGNAYIAYIPDKYIIGLSKIPRIVDMYSQRLQVQEKLTTDIVTALQEVLKPKGVAIIVTGTHTCASIRGVKKHGSRMRTMKFTGVFKTESNRKEEFFKLITIE